MNLLYVEDVAVNAKVMKAFVKHLWSIELQTRDSAELGLELMHELKFDLVFMDINLPGMSGHEAISSIRKRDEGCEVPIIAVSADVSKKNIDRSFECGANDFIAKPVQIDVLKNKTEKLLLNRYS